MGMWTHRTEIWSQGHPYCSRCGQPNEQIEGGLKLQCTANSRHRFYPRTDPVVSLSLFLSNARSQNWSCHLDSVFTGSSMSAWVFVVKRRSSTLIFPLSGLFLGLASKTAGMSCLSLLTRSHSGSFHTGNVCHPKSLRKVFKTSITMTSCAGDNDGGEQ